ncbi:EpsG family protein [Idiomarina abyssalis]|uniref:EpsG family protein n=1 Tax=Idiomarina abyssalis TaxID=86102 RepID=UPI003A933688
MGSNYIELITYLLVVIIALTFSVINTSKLSDSVKFLIFMVVSTGLSLVVRLSNFDTDIQTYAESMRFESLSFYYFREPVVWFGQRFLFSLIGSEFIVFFLFDLLMFTVTYLALRNYRLPYYAFFSFLTFFPFILGMQNVYRQWVSVLFCLLAISYSFGSSRSAVRYFTFFISGLSHNVAGVFLAPFLMLSSSKIFRFFGVGILFLTPLIIHFASGTKSATSTGASLAFAYVFVICLITIFMFLSMRLKIYSREIKALTILISSFFVVFASVFMLSSTAAERVGLFSLCLLYPHLILFCERYYKQRFLLRSLIVIFGFFPLLLFGTRHFIL